MEKKKVLLRIKGTKKDLRWKRKKLIRLGFHERAFKNRIIFEKIFEGFWEIHTCKKLLRYYQSYKGCSALIVDAPYIRSRTYRSQFFKTNQGRNGKFRCIYCGKWLKKEDVTVDHIIPVDRVRRSQRAKLFLRMIGAKTVNDPKNLGCACERCNKSKGNKMGIWILIGRLGKHECYWGIRFFFQILFFFILAVLLGQYCFANMINVL